MLGAGLLAVAVAWQLVVRRPAAPTRTPSGLVSAVAVLPFEDLAGGADTSYLGEGMTEGLIADLAQIGSLKVISRESGAVAQGAAARSRSWRASSASMPS